MSTGGRKPPVPRETTPKPEPPKPEPPKEPTVSYSRPYVYCLPDVPSESTVWCLILVVIWVALCSAPAWMPALGLGH